MDIKSSASESLKILVFKFSKNEKEVKKKGDVGELMDDNINQYIENNR